LLFWVCRYCDWYCFNVIVIEIVSAIVFCLFVFGCCPSYSSSRFVAGVYIFLQKSTTKKIIPRSHIDISIPFLTSQARARAPNPNPKFVRLTFFQPNANERLQALLPGRSPSRGATSCLWTMWMQTYARWR
jgi:hypothetical protein